MKIGKDYKIESDELNVKLIKRSTALKGKDKGKDVWNVIGFFQTAKGALDVMVDRRIKGTGMDKYESVVYEIELIKEDIRGTTNL